MEFAQAVRRTSTSSLIAGRRSDEASDVAPFKRAPVAGKKQAITIRSSGGLSDAEIERMVNEAESMRVPWWLLKGPWSMAEDADQRKKDTVQAKNDGENLAYQVEKQLTELKDSA